MKILFAIWFGMYPGMPGLVITDVAMEAIQTDCRAFATATHSTHFSVVKQNEFAQFVVQGKQYKAEMNGFYAVCIGTERDAQGSAT